MDGIGGKQAEAARGDGNETMTEAADPQTMVKPRAPKVSKISFLAMQRLFTATLMASVLLFACGAQACEKHLNGHQTSSNTAAETLKN